MQLFFLFQSYSQKQLLILTDQQLPIFLYCLKDLRNFLQTVAGKYNSQNIKNSIQLKLCSDVQKLQCQISEFNLNKIIQICSSYCLLTHHLRYLQECLGVVLEDRIKDVMMKMSMFFPLMMIIVNEILDIVV